MRELHEFFARWFSGWLEEDEIGRLEVALHPDFTIVGPTGATLDRDGIISGVRAGHGRGATSIDIHGLATLHQEDGILIGRYEEWQSRKLADVVEERRLRSTAVFVTDDAAPNGVRWLTVHETFIDEPSDP